MNEQQEHNLDIRIDVSDTPDKLLLDADIYNVRIQSLEPATHDESGRLRLRGEFRVLDEDFANWPVFSDIWLGTDDDPFARLPETQRRGRGFIALRGLLKATGTPLVGQLQDMCRAMVGKHCLAKVGIYTAKTTGNQGNQINAFYALGEREITRSSANATAAHVAPSIAVKTGQPPRVAYGAQGGGPTQAGRGPRPLPPTGTGGEDWD